MAERIISADSHVDISRDRVLANLPSQYHDAYKESGMGMMRRMMEGKPQKQLKNKATPAAENTTGPMPSEHPWEAAGRPGAYDPHERLKDMDIDKVDAEVLYCSATGGAEYYSLEPDACLAAFQAFNSAAIEFASVSPDRAADRQRRRARDPVPAVSGGV
jgi:hypothetical protein